MKMVCVLFLLFFCHGFCFKVWGKKNSSRPDCIKIGAIFNLNSTIGRVAKIAIDAAISDINSNFGVLGGPKLIVRTMDTNFSGFLSIIEALQFMESDVIAIIGPQSSETAHMISHISNELMVPLLSFSATDPSLTSLEYPFFVRMTQSDLFQMAAIAEIIDYYQWRQVIAVYIDDDYGRNGIAVLGDKLQERRCKISYKAKLPPGASQSAIFDVLFKVSLMESRVIILHMNADSGLLVLSVANSLSMMTSGYVWITTDWLSAVFDSTPLPPETMDRIQGVIALRQYTEDSKKKRVFISRWGELASKQGFNSLGLNSYGFYAYDSVWTVAYAINGFFNDGGTITFSNNSKIKDIDKGSLHLEALTMFNGGSLLLRKILETKFEGISGQVQFDSDKSLVHPAYEILNVVGTGYHRIGFWSNYSGLSTEPPDILYMKPPNRSSSSQKLSSVIWPGDVITLPRGWVFPQNGKQLKIGVPDRVSYREFISKVKGTDIVKGYCIDVFLAAVNLLPYAFQFEFIPFGNGRENPNFNELVNLVASNVFDAAIGDIAIVTNRTKIVDFTQPYIESGLVIVAPTKRLSSSAWAFLRPFTVEMWCVTGAFFIVVGVVVWILEHRINDDFRGSPRQQIVTILWFIFSTLFFAHRENTASTLARFVLIIWLFVVLIINSSYTASLTSILTVQQLSSPVKGIESLISGNDPIGFQVGSFAENYMVQELHIDHSRLKSLGTPEEYADALKRGPQNGGVTAIVDELPYVELFLSKECKFSIIGQEFTKSGWGFIVKYIQEKKNLTEIHPMFHAFPRDSPLAIDMSTAILSLSENGDLQRIHDKWLTRSGCPTQSSEVIEANRLHLSSFWGLFMICGVACFIAILIYLILLCRQFSRHVSQQPRSPNLSSYRTFLSFANEKKAEKSENSSTSKKAQIQEPSNNNASTL